jgi:hypothetical protein
MASRTTQKVRSHLQAKIYLAGTEIGSGRAQSFDADHDFGTQAVHGVGDYEAAEHVFLKFNGTLTLDTFMIREQDLVNLGVAALGKEILDLEVLEVTLHDENGLTLRNYEDCVIQRYRETIRQGEICGENATMFFRTASKGGATGAEQAPAQTGLTPSAPAITQ